METEKNELTTPSGLALVLKAFVTGIEKREYRRFLMDLEEKPNTTSAQKLDLGEDKLLELVVVSFNGSDKEIVKRVVESKDYEFIVDEARKVYTGFDDKKKATSEESTNTTSEESQLS